MFKRLLRDIRYFKFLNAYPTLNLGSFLVVLFCILVMLISTFTQIPMFLFNFSWNNLLDIFASFGGHGAADKASTYYYYVPQIPAVLFTGAMLGYRVGMFAILVYLIIGLVGFPVFASGGGLFYYLKPGFGYILGYSLAIYTVGRILEHKVTNFNIIRAAIVGVLAVHVIGIIYLTVLLTLQHNSIFYILSWIYAMSGIQVPYDLLFGLVAIGLARPMRGIFWLAMD